MGFQTGQNRSKAVKTGQNFLCWWKMDISTVILTRSSKNILQKQAKNRFHKFSHSNKSTKQYAERSRSAQQPSIINHQSSIINHQSPITNHQSSIINKQPTATPPLLPLINILRSSFLQKK
ncbi:hypothetical protein [uncultured Chryseobacterium sp.]|uniref:hypothetical protein n=1 Tax=uncultured Chryseobacterium sp. TaxID=259322 RepID=UPI00258C505C|nr:hypothetical protein [uncultured Chryseobacterium sp.]